MHRFYIPPADWRLDDLCLDDAQSHHCVNVLRLAPGAKIVVFNGLGLETTAEIIAPAARKQVRLTALQTVKFPPLPCRITLAQAVPKGKNMDLIVQKATELGASAIVPLLSERTVTRLDDDTGAHAKQQKWQAIAVEAAKQCGQNWLPAVSAPATPRAFFAAQARQAYDLMLVASLQPGARPLRAWLDRFSTAHSGRRPASALILVGPEGDFTPAEIAQALTAGCQPITLGPIVLRTETAAIYGLSVLSYELLNPPPF